MSCTSWHHNNNNDLELDAKLEFPDKPFDGDVYVDFQKKAFDYPKVAVLPFKAAVELAGVSISDAFTTELLKTSRYSLIERSQMENVLKEQELNISGVIDSSDAINLGKVLGVQGVVIGTVAEYGFQRVRISRVPSIGLSVRMIDTTTGKIVWSVSHSAVGNSKLSLSQLADTMIGDMVYALSRAWIDAGDTTVAGLPPPRDLSSVGGVRSAALSWKPHVSSVIEGYEIFRKDPRETSYKSIARIKKNIKSKMSYVDEKLLDMTLYSYQVRTISRFGMVGSASAETQVITAGPPSSPKGFSAKSNLIRSVSLSWIVSDDPTVEGYIISRKDPTQTIASIIAKITNCKTTEYLDKGTSYTTLKDNTQYIYTIQSYNIANAKSAPSAPVFATTKATPSQPSNVQAIGGMPKSVLIKWTKNLEQEEIKGYYIYSANTPDGPFMKLNGQIQIYTPQYTDRYSYNRKLKDNTTYYYKVSAYNIGGVEGPKSPVVNAITKAPPQKVQGLTASQGLANKIVLKWKPVACKDLKEYCIYRSTSHAGYAVKIGTTDADISTYTDTCNLSHGSIYVYKVVAIDTDSLESQSSVETEGSTKAIPEPPLQVKCTPLHESATLTWSASKSKDISKYIVNSIYHSRPKKIGETTRTSFTAKNLKPNKAYTFSVIAEDTDGLCSEQSVLTSCTTK